MRKPQFETQYWTSGFQSSCKTLGVAALSCRQAQRWISGQISKSSRACLRREVTGQTAAPLNWRDQQASRERHSSPGQRAITLNPCGSRRPQRENQTTVDKLWEARGRQVLEIKTISGDLITGGPTLLWILPSERWPGALREQPLPPGGVGAVLKQDETSHSSGKAATSGKPSNQSPAGWGFTWAFRTWRKGNSRLQPTGAILSHLQSRQERGMGNEKQVWSSSKEDSWKENWQAIFHEN